jgi:hypothetical protein
MSALLPKSGHSVARTGCLLEGILSRVSIFITDVLRWLRTYRGKAMRKTWIGAALAPALALLAGPLWAQQRTPTIVVACGGPFAKDSSHLKLAMFFDSKNITFTDVEASGSKVPASVLFPNDPKRRLEVWWSNPTTRNDIHLIVIGGQSTWAAPGGLRLGQTLEQVEKLNHKPFKLKGFDKDRIATGSNWDGGALVTAAGGCRPGVSLRADAKASAEEIGALSADKEYSSSDPAIRAAKPTVSEILIGY